MNLTTLPRSVLRLQYKIARFPLGFVEQQLRFLPADAPPRRMYERGLGMLDGIVGSVLDDPEIATRGALVAEQETRRAEEEKTPATKIESEKISLKDAVAKRLEAKEAEERAHDAGDVAEFEKIEHRHP